MTIQFHAFKGRDQNRFLAAEELPAVSRAALGQFTVERLMAYGLTHADAIELRGRVSAGEEWREAALSIAEDLQAQLHERSTSLSRINILYRSSAMLRMAQVMMIEDTDERRAIFCEAARLFALAAGLQSNPVRCEVTTRHGILVSWRYCSDTDPVGIALVIGGIEGWAMDFAELSRWLSLRGVEAWALDGPGQGESRFLHGHYLNAHWREAYEDVISYVRELRPDVPLAVVGSSVGGTLALEIAAHDPRVDICVSNGGPISGNTILGRQEAKVPKKQMMCGPQSSSHDADAIWSGIDVRNIGARVTCPVLIVHGQRDPLISDQEVQEIYSCLASSDKHMITFSDGDHCIYNHADDKHIVMTDWISVKLRELHESNPEQAVLA